MSYPKIGAFGWFPAFISLHIVIILHIIFSFGKNLGIVLFFALWAVAVLLISSISKQARTALAYDEFIVGFTLKKKIISRLLWFAFFSFSFLYYLWFASSFSR